MIFKIDNNLFIAIFLAIVPLRTCTLVESNPDFDGAPSDSLRILSLGDSYTIGQSVMRDDRWPNQLIDSLQYNNYYIIENSIIARTGWTTADLLHAISKQDLSSGYHLVGLLIGVNNQFRGLDISVYETEFEELLITAIKLAGDRNNAVFVLSVPDYSVTPTGRAFSNDQTSAQIDKYNAVNRRIAQKYNVIYFDITPLSRTAADDPQLIASDSLHFSGEMYTKWVEVLLPEALSMLQYQDATLKF